MEDNQIQVETQPEAPIRILKADEVVVYLNQIKGAMSLVSDYLKNIENDIEANLTKINEENNTDAS
jgi:lipopolysaccharide/colanic/teichoic acid biosynthesis glycosyltransferase